MTLATKFHNAIVDYNILTKPTEAIKEYFAYHPEVFKIALLANHIFRAASMAGFMMLLPFSMPVSIAICTIGSLFYRLTVESNCAYKFALPSLGGAAAFIIGKETLVNGVALASFEAFAASCVPLIPLGLYAAYVVLTVSYDVDNRPCPFCRDENVN